jgi:ATP-binding cassette subfamily B (MDR/TAP) protein 1
VPDDFETCQDYWNATADHMRELSFQTIYLLIGLIGCTMFGNIIMFQGFGTATERINKRVRDKTFRALICQEVSWYDVRSVGEITSQLSDDAAMIHSFSGEPIRTFMMTVASVGAGLIVSFYFMWEVSTVNEYLRLFCCTVYLTLKNTSCSSTVCFCCTRYVCS